MKISHGDLELCLRNPKHWFASAGGSSHPFNMGYDRALQYAIYHYHSSSAQGARAHLTSIITRHNFKNAARVTEIESALDSYIAWARRENLRTAAVKVNISLACGFLELRGEIGRIDVTPLGYRAIILKAPPLGWQDQLRMPLIQEAISTMFGRPADDVEVGFQRLDSSNLQTVCYHPRRRESARTRFRNLGKALRRLSRAKP
jgi:hypothetical protein